ncbi:Biofilm PIA synthesis N-glycosyltransferase icaA [Fibrisoma limi BUZ 3]|uniref:Biofilm PIA synthesis N-glycosyltransferase icaA n=1 Tax=Fibrisoma limi BUZ 3 TaxID=1185876 RepID=I2GQ03_9BACT|nr:glycosyltransferase family 2 protein [Fibrisoma limi]CCH55981.1 Biofilm PIA synthesis N-glycosyltransferase icaA [Fibrisoma limi BUZ 3]
MKIAFWIVLFLAVYTYLGYGVLVWAIVKIRRWLGKGHAEPNWRTTYLPDVTLVVPAYNEMGCLPDKLANCLSLDYPADKLSLLFVAEGSTDGSIAYLQQEQTKYPNLKVIGGGDRLGKIEAMNRAMKQVKTSLVIYTDANTVLNREAIRNTVRHFQDPEVAAVAGEKRIMTDNSEAAAGAGEGLYWRYESFLKKLDTELHTVVGAAGEFFAMRTALYEPVEFDTLLDDFMISLRLAGRGYRVVYEPEAYAMERPSFSVSEEQKRKVRIAAGGFQSIARLTDLLNPFKHGWLTFQYVSHRAMRWAVTPFCLPILVLLNALIVAIDGGWFWWLLLAGQITFYTAAYAGYQLEARRIRNKALFVPFYFTFMNVCVLLGFVRYHRGGHNGIWEKARRADDLPNSTHEPALESVP